MRSLISVRLHLYIWLLASFPLWTCSLPQDDDRMISFQEESLSVTSDYVRVDMFLKDARTHEVQNAFDAALKDYEAARNLAEKLNNKQPLVKALKDLGIFYWERNNFQMALSTFKEQSEIIKEYGLDSLLPACYNNLGLVYFSLNQYTQAIECYSLAIGEYRRLNNEKELGTALLNLGILLKNQGIYDNALQLLFESERYLTDSSQQLDLASVYEAIGLTDHNLKRFAEALDYHERALAIRQDAGYTNGVAKSLNNIGMALSQLKRYDSAFTYYHEALKIKETFSDLRSTISTLINIGMLHQQQGNLIKAKEAFLTALNRMDIGAGGKEGVILYHLLAELETNQGVYARAARYLIEAEKMAESMQSLYLLVENLKLKMELARAQKNYFEALHLYDQYNALKDSVLDTDKQNHISQLQVLHKVEEKEKENKMLRQESLVQKIEIKGEKQKVLFLVILALLMLIIAVISIYSYLVKRKSNRIIKLMMRELHHRVTNNLQLISSLLSLQSSNLRDKKAIEAVRSSENRVNAMAIIHQKLYKKEDVRKLNLLEFTENLVSYLQKVYHSDAVKIDIQIPDIELDVDRAIPLGLILNELVSNAFKHTKSYIEKPEITIFMITEDDRLVLVVADNGPGFPTGFHIENSTSFGLKMVQLLSRQIKATLNITSANGVKFELRI